jgi:hypothetical protein
MTTPSLSNKWNRVIRANLAGCVNSSELVVQLKHHGLFDINDGQGFTVTCIDGTVWITQANDPRDIVINAGQSFLLDKQGLALVAAPAGPATIAVCQASSEPPSIQFDLQRGIRASERKWSDDRAESEPRKYFNLIGRHKDANRSSIKGYRSRRT